MKCETRSIAAEMRMKGRKLEGYAAIFGTETRIGDAFTETIAAGAFETSLASGRDVLALVDHDPTRILGRTRSRSLRLSEDRRGLAFEIDMPDTQTGRDVLALAERGDLGGMSFGFTAIDEHRDGDRRELREVSLYEISVIHSFAAYPDTVIQARARNIGHPDLAHAQRVLKILEAMKWG